MSNKGKVFHTHYVELRFADSTRTTMKITSLTRRQAILNAMRDCKRDDVRTVYCPEGVPKSEAEQQKKLNYKRAAKERHKKRIEDRIAVYDGLTRIK